MPPETITVRKKIKHSNIKHRSQWSNRNIHLMSYQPKQITTGQKLYSIYQAGKAICLLKIYYTHVKVLLLLLQFCTRNTDTATSPGNINVLLGRKYQNRVDSHHLTLYLNTTRSHQTVIMLIFANSFKLINLLVWLLSTKAIKIQQ